MGCLMFFMLAGFAAVMGVYVSALIAYLGVIFTIMAGYLSFYMSAFTAFMLLFVL